jgi:hypothetical protein
VVEKKTEEVKVKTEEVKVKTKVIKVKTERKEKNPRPTPKRRSKRQTSPGIEDEDVEMTIETVEPIVKKKEKKIKKDKTRVVESDDKDMDAVAEELVVKKEVKSSSSKGKRKARESDDSGEDAEPPKKTLTIPGPPSRGSSRYPSRSRGNTPSQNSEHVDFISMLFI